MTYRQKEIKRLNDLMKEKQLSYYRVGKESGVNQMTVSNFLKGKNDALYFSTYLPIRNAIENYEG